MAASVGTSRTPFDVSCTPIAFVCPQIVVGVALDGKEWQ